MFTAFRAAARLGRHGFFAHTRQFLSTSSSLFKLSDEPVTRLQQLASQAPERLSRLLSAAKSVQDDPVFLTADTETTGIHTDKYGPQRVLELGLVASRGGITESANHFLINPCRPVQSRALQIHGIGSSGFLKLPTFSTIATNFLDLINAYPNASLWFHNAPFDKRMLEAEFARVSPDHQTLFSATNICCSLSLARLLRTKHNKLDDLLARYGIDASSREQGHGALIDSQLLANVLPKLADEVLTAAEKASVLDDMLSVEQPSSYKP